MNQVFRGFLKKKSMPLAPELLPKEQEQEGGGRCCAGREEISNGDKGCGRERLPWLPPLAASIPPPVPAAPAVPRLRGDLHLGCDPAASASPWQESCGATGILVPW